jgi:mannose-1-phosphate guanylyltransferase
MAGANPTSPIAVIMAGGSGTRFWPASTKDKPKQYLDLWGADSLIQKTVNRIRPLVDDSRVYICSTQDQKRWLDQQLSTIAHPGWQILEPQGKNTAPCLMLSALTLRQAGHSDDTPLVVLPADHFIGNETAFRTHLQRALQFAVESQGLLTFGIRPTQPHSGYGYIEAGPATPTPGVFAIQRFVEKPDRATAERYLASGRFFWNSGIFVWTLGAISRAFETFMPNEWKRLAAHLAAPAEVYAGLPSVAVDVAIMEKATNGFVIPAADLEWSDVGSWDALYELNPKNDADQNVVLSAGKVSAIESHGCLIKAAATRHVALVGVDDLIVVESGDSLLIAHRSKDQLVKKITDPK